MCFSGAKHDLSSFYFVVVLANLLAALVGLYKPLLLVWAAFSCLAERLSCASHGHFSRHHGRFI